MYCQSILLLILSFRCACMYKRLIKIKTTNKMEIIFFLFQWLSSSDLIQNFNSVLLEKSIGFIAEANRFCGGEPKNFLGSIILICQV